MEQTTVQRVGIMVQSIVGKLKAGWLPTKRLSIPKTARWQWFGALLLIIGSVVVWETVVRADSVTPITGAAKERPATPARLTLRDGIMGYELDYPAGWRVEADAGWLTTLYSYPATDAVEAVAAPLSKIEIVPISGASTLAQLAAQLQAHDGAPPALRQTIIGGVPAVRADIVTFSGEPARVILIVLDGQAMQLVGYGDLDAFDAVVSTLRPAHPVV
jgi:hypothetical protein